jgi:hypothetical protein
MRKAILVCLLPLAACIPASPPSSDDDVGVIQIAVAAGPPDAACLRVTVAGSGASTVRTIDLMPGASTMRTLGGLPVGQVTVSGEAFNVACPALSSASAPTWVSDPAPAFLTAGTPVPVQITMRPAGQINITVDWNSGGGGAGGGMGGTSGGRGGAGGSMGGASGGGGTGGLADVARVLDGQMLLAPCLRDTQAAVCATVAGTCPASTDTDVALRGAHLTDKSVTLGGTPGTTYAITLHIQGEVESKQYTNGVDQESMLLSPTADGFAIGGTPTLTNAYAVYLLRVTNPGAMTNTDYFLNSLQPPGTSNHTTYGVDYTATIRAQGGATIRLLVSDSNCSQIKNCGPVENDGNTCAQPIVLQNVESSAVAANPTFNFNVAYNGQWMTMAVKNVTVATTP